MSSKVPREYYAQLCGTGISCGAGVVSWGHIFGFDATQVLCINDTDNNLYVSFASTAGSTGGMLLQTGERMALSGIATYGIGLAATTTSTGQFLRLAAWAW
jgi:hypothetical protein